MYGTKCRKQRTRLLSLVQFLIDSQSDCDSGLHPSGLYPTIRPSPQSTALDKSLPCREIHSGIPVPAETSPSWLSRQDPNYPPTLVCLWSLNLLTTEWRSFNYQMFSFTKYVYVQFLFPNMLWFSWLCGLPIFACNTLPASVNLRLSLLWRWRFVSYIIYFLNTPDYRNHSLLWTVKHWHFLCSTLNYSASSLYTSPDFPAWFPVPW